MNGAASLLVLAAIANAAPSDLVTPGPSAFPSAPRKWLCEPTRRPRSHRMECLSSLLIQNDSDEEDRLLGASTPVAKCGRVRRAFLVNGRRETVPVPEGIVISAQASITL